VNDNTRVDPVPNVPGRTRELLWEVVPVAFALLATCLLVFVAPSRIVEMHG
jgi:hypothetical protein